MRIGRKTRRDKGHWIHAGPFYGTLDKDQPKVGQLIIGDDHPDLPTTARVTHVRTVGYLSIGVADFSWSQIDEALVVVFGLQKYSHSARSGEDVKYQLGTQARPSWLYWTGAYGTLSSGGSDDLDSRDWKQIGGFFWNKQDLENHGTGSGDGASRYTIPVDWTMPVSVDLEKESFGLSVEAAKLVTSDEASVGWRCYVFSMLRSYVLVNPGL